MGALTLVTLKSKLSPMRVKIVDEVPAIRLFGTDGPGGGTYGECFYLTIKDDAVFARCMFEGWSGIWELELSWLLHESEDGPTTYV